MERFHGVLEEARQGGCFVLLPAEVLERLGGGSRFRVRGALGGVPFFSSTMAMGGGQVALGVHKATREAAGATYSDEVVVDVERDNAPRVVPVPDELRAALDADEVARVEFDSLAPTHRNEFASWVAEAKREETRARRVAQTLERLRARRPGA